MSLIGPIAGLLPSAFLLQETWCCAGRCVGVTVPCLPSLFSNKQHVYRSAGISHVALQPTGYGPVFSAYACPWRPIPTEGGKSTCGAMGPAIVARHVVMLGLLSRILCGVCFVMCLQTYEEAAQQAALSRLYGGIHISIDNDEA